MLSNAIHDIQKTIADVWVFDVETYPNMGIEYKPGITSIRTGRAAIHVALHIAKTSGKLVGLVEPFDHGQTDINKAELTRQIAYMIINVLRLAEVYFISPGDVLVEIKRWADEMTAKDQGPT